VPGVGILYSHELHIFWLCDRYGKRL